jgi:hypothetical protein
MVSVKIAVALGVIALLFVSLPAAAASGPPQQRGPTTPLNLNLEGIITSAGGQNYHFSGGSLYYGEILGAALSYSASVNFNVDANVNGLNTQGNAMITVNNGSTPGPAGDININVQINAEEAAAFLPVGCVMPPNPPSPPSPPGPLGSQNNLCSSEIPFMFNGTATINIPTTPPTSPQNGVHPAPPLLGAPPAPSPYPQLPIRVPVVIESPYWNPFGGPIVIASTDQAQSILLVVGYSTAVINWNQVQLQGAVLPGSTFGTSEVTGGYMTMTDSQENLVTGAEQDNGQIIFSGMSNPTLNGEGRLSGSTAIPPFNPSSVIGTGPTGNNPYDCTSSFGSFGLYFESVVGLPLCVVTGATSSGSFQANGSPGVQVSGSYDTAWSVPSLTTMTTVVGTVTQT